MTAILVLMTFVAGVLFLAELADDHLRAVEQNRMRQLHKRRIEAALQKNRGFRKGLA